MGNLDVSEELARIDAASAELWASYGAWVRGPLADRIADVVALTALSDLLLAESIPLGFDIGFRPSTRSGPANPSNGASK